MSCLLGVLVGFAAIGADIIDDLKLATLFFLIYRVFAILYDVLSRTAFLIDLLLMWLRAK